MDAFRPFGPEIPEPDLGMLRIVRFPAVLVSYLRIADRRNALFDSEGLPFGSTRDLYPGRKRKNRNKKENRPEGAVFFSIPSRTFVCRSNFFSKPFSNLRILRIRVTNEGNT